jgi:hypothetical protein
VRLKDTDLLDMGVGPEKGVHLLTNLGNGAKYILSYYLAKTNFILIVTMSLLAYARLDMALIQCIIPLCPGATYLKVSR